MTEMVSMIGDNIILRGTLPTLDTQYSGGNESPNRQCQLSSLGPHRSIDLFDA